MKHIISSIALALSSIAMVGCFGSSKTPLEFASTPPTTAFVGQEYRYDITVTPISARGYEITAEGLPDWLELKTEEALPVNFGDFNGRVTYMAAHEEDIYFIGISDSGPRKSEEVLFSIPLGSNGTPRSIYDFAPGVEHAGGLAIRNGSLYVAINRRSSEGSSDGAVVIRKFNLSVSPHTQEVIFTTPGKVASLAVADNGRVYWTDGSPMFSSVSAQELQRENPQIFRYAANHAPLMIGYDEANHLYAGSAPSSLSYYFVVFNVDSLLSVASKLYSQEEGCLTGIAGNPGSGTYFSTINCHSEDELKSGHLYYVPNDWPSATSAGTTPVKDPGQILDGQASAVTVTAAGRVVWASVAERSLRHFTLQQNTLVGTPPAPGNYDITLKLNSDKVQKFTITVTEPPAPVGFEVKGVVHGLQGLVQLSNNDTDIIAVNRSTVGSSSFSFSQRVQQGDDFDVAVLANPGNQTCTLRNAEAASGAMGSADVDVIVDCEFNTYRIGGTVSDLNGTLVLILNEGLATEQGIDVTEDTFTFGDDFAVGFEYNIAIKTQPAGQECELNADRFVNEEGEDQTPVVNGNVELSITCEDVTVVEPDPEYTLSVAVEGLPEGTTVAMRAWGPEDGRWAQENKAFSLGTGSFNNTMRDGEIFDIRIITDPDGYSCNITGESPLAGDIDGYGIVDGDVTITVTCTEDTGGGGDPTDPGDDGCDEFEPFCDGEFFP